MAAPALVTLWHDPACVPSRNTLTVAAGRPVTTP
jgi:hypothetical protein